MSTDEDPLIDEPTLLKALLKVRHWQKRDTFAQQWDDVAKTINDKLVGSCPEHAQFYRWLRGNIRTMPNPDACRILEAMFPSWTVQQLFQPVQVKRSELLQLSRATNPGGRMILDTLIQRIRDPGPYDGGAWTKNRDARIPIATQAGLGLISHGRNSASDLGMNSFESQIGEKLILLGQRLRMSRGELESIAQLTDHVIELDTAITIDISVDGKAIVEFDRLILNLMDHPISRLSWDIWFKHTYTNVNVTPGANNSRNARIAVMHDTANLAKFATVMSPPVESGDTARLSYICHGGLFTDSLYWRRNIPRHTRHFTMTVRHCSPNRLMGCTATEEFPDGSERSAMECMSWDTRDGVHIFHLTRDYLRPGQAMTLRWEIEK